MNHLIRMLQLVGLYLKSFSTLGYIHQSSASSHAVLTTQSRGDWFCFLLTKPDQNLQ